MALIFKVFFAVVGFYVLVTVLSMLSLVIRVRRHLRNPFATPPRDDLSDPGAANIIEGEYKVLDEDKAKR